MSRDRPSLGTAGTSGRRFLRGVAGLSLGAASLGALVACQSRPARPASKRLPLIGYFGDGTQRGNAAAVRNGLAASGYGEGQTITIEWRYSDFNDQSQRAAIAQELVDLHPDVIVADTHSRVEALLHLTRTIPIVGIWPGGVGAEQLTRDGEIQSQLRPGGNVTGLIGSTPTLAGKRLDLLHEALPGATRLAVLHDSGEPDPYRPYPEWTSDVLSIGVSGPEDLDGAFARFEQQQSELLAVAGGGGASRVFTFGDRIAEQARRRHLPAVGDFESFAKTGGLMSYEVDLGSLYRGVGRFVDKILKGAKPAELPVELPTTFRFIVNKATADALGLTIPPAVLAQATEVLQ